MVFCLSQVRGFDAWSSSSPSRLAAVEVSKIRTRIFINIILISGSRNNLSLKLEQRKDMTLGVFSSTNPQEPGPVGATSMLWLPAIA